MRKGSKGGPRGEIRLTGGVLRGRKVRVPPGAVRPTQDRVREAVFSMIGPVLEGARVLDLFAGTGAMGLEAWSRGAGAVWWVEQDRMLATALEETVGALCVDGGRTRCVRAEVMGFLENPPPGALDFDVVFADPPYDVGGSEGMLQKTLLRLSAKPILTFTGRVVFEQSASASAPEVAGWSVLRDRRYGATRILVMGRAAGAPEEET